MSDPIGHHIVPAFYLESWCNSEGLIPCFVRKKDGRFRRLMVRPQSTPRENWLYSLDKVAPEHRQIVEKYFFATEVDGKGAAVLPKLKRGEIDALTDAERMDWIRFLIAARLRVPEVIHDLKVGAAEFLRRSLLEAPEEIVAITGDPGNPHALLEWAERNFVGLIDSFGILTLPKIIADPEHTKIIANMHWWVEDLSRANVRLLTSDRPLWVSDGLKNPNSLVAMALSPTAVFFASHNARFRAKLTREGPNRLVRRCNRTIASQAARFVYGDAELSFVQRRPRLSIRTPFQG